MNRLHRSCLPLLIAFLMAGDLRAEIQTVAEHNSNETATADFKFPTVPSPSLTDAAGSARLAVVSGRLDPNSGGVKRLGDGKLPATNDEPSANFFFAAAGRGGRLLLDLGSITTVQRINTYSWHRSTRGPQVYGLYVADGSAQGFALEPKADANPVDCGWRHLTDVNTRPETGEAGGQYGVTISDSAGPLGQIRYILLEMAPTETADSFGNTFYSEIDVDDGTVHEVPNPVTPEPRVEVVTTEGGDYQITIDTTQTPDLTNWVHEQLAPVVREWYPKIVTLLSSEGYEAPSKFVIRFDAEMRGVAATSGTEVRCAADWMQKNLEGEAKGAVVHELVHVVQQYNRVGRRDRRAAPTPGWLVEGIADYVRWYLYEPESHGADITRRNASRAQYDASYRVSANFINWVTQKYDPQLVTKLNAAAREGRYQVDLWKEYTGNTLQELGDEWKAALAK